jgi:hypothetical protein
MTRSTSAAWTSALFAIVLAAAQVHASAQSKPAAKPAPAKAAPAKAVPAKVAAAKAVVPVEPANSVTMTGCLETDGTRYRLTDVQGNQVAKGRNWKTGFITKKSKNVDVVGASSSLKLDDHVGHTITVVGVKDGDTHLKARSIKQIGSCS